MEHYFLIGMGSFCFATLLNAFLQKKYAHEFQKFYQSEGFRSFKNYRMGVYITAALFGHVFMNTLPPTRPIPVIILDTFFFLVIADIVLIHLLFFTKMQSLNLSKKSFWKVVISRYSYYLSFICLYFSFGFYKPPFF